jgi:hypothetical protein
MEDLGIEELKQLISFYKQRANELEYINLQWQLRHNKLLQNSSKPVPATKITKTKSE